MWSEWASTRTIANRIHRNHTFQLTCKEKRLRHRFQNPSSVGGGSGHILGRSPLPTSRPSFRLCNQTTSGTGRCKFAAEVGAQGSNLVEGGDTVLAGAPMLKAPNRSARPARACPNRLEQLGTESTNVSSQTHSSTNSSAWAWPDLFCTSVAADLSFDLLLD